MTNRIYIYINGINTWPGSSKNWNGKAVTWTHLHTYHRAEKVEYLVGPLSRALGQKKRAQKLAKTLTFYTGWEIVLVGHSNGCDVITDALKQMDPLPVISQLHLISAATHADYRKNGLNESAVKHVTVWIAEKDFALRLANLKLSRIFGYGALGKLGPIKPKIPTEIIRKSIGHSDWFGPDLFDATMMEITRE